MKRIWILFILLVLASGCTQEQGLKEIRIDGHGQHVYQFSSDVRESLKVKTNDAAGIREAVFSADELNFVFNGSSSEDNAYFQVLIFNIVSKFQTYFAYEGKLMKFQAYYYSYGSWYNATDKIEEPDLELVLWIIGPNTGANETSVILKDNRIYLQGTSYKNLVLAGDRFALAVFGITDITTTESNF